MKIEKLADDKYRIHDDARSLEFDKEHYEDLFYAVPVDSTAFYRLLTEAVCETEDERKTMVAMIEALPDMDSGLKALMDDIAALGA
jgi:hypothetical protein